MELTEVPLHAVDYAIMALYMLGLIGLGLYYRGFAQESMEGRKCCARLSCRLVSML